jgi:hypothetical protein
MNNESQNNLPKINWLASYPKSGNTWIRLLLYVYTYGKFETIDQVHGFTPSDTIPGYWFAGSPIPWGLLNNDQKMLVRYSALFNLILNSTKQPIITKTHCANIQYNSVDLIPNELTDNSVYLVRDPRDVVSSYSHHMGISIDKAVETLNNPKNLLFIDEGADLGIIQPLASWTIHVNSWKDHLVIKYEDLLKSTEVELTKIVEHFYKEKANKKKIAKAVKFCKFKKLKKLEQKHGFKEATKNGKFFRNGKSKTWKDTLTEAQVKKLEQDHGEVMEQLGYKLEYL